MRLRELREKDAYLMLEWMHDYSVVENLNDDFSNKSIEDCNNFILASNYDTNNIHFAIVDVDDEYLGTVSLKNIKKDAAEFAIVIRKCAMHRGISKEAMKQTILKGFKENGLKYIYWYVSKENTRAINFYKKNGYKEVEKEQIEKKCQLNDLDFNKYKWYLIENECFSNNSNSNI